MEERQESNLRRLVLGEVSQNHPFGGWWNAAVEVRIAAKAVVYECPLTGSQPVCWLDALRYRKFAMNSSSLRERLSTARTVPLHQS